MTKADNLHVEIISPSGFVFDGYCYLVTIPGTEGDLGIMNNHEPTLAKLREGKISIYDENNKIIQDFAVTGGFAQNTEGKLLILLDK